MSAVRPVQHLLPPLPGHQQPRGAPAVARSGHQVPRARAARSGRAAGDALEEAGRGARLVRARAGEASTGLGVRPGGSWEGGVVEVMVRNVIFQFVITDISHHRSIHLLVVTFLPLRDIFSPSVGQWDIEWRLLSLLVNLSHNPTSVASRPRPAPGQPPLAAVSEAGEERWQEQEQEPDWRRELLVPEPEYSSYQSPVRREGGGPVRGESCWCQSPSTAPTRVR